jgi:polyferredoxin
VGKKTHILRPRIIAYALLLIVLCGAFVFTVFTRVPLELDIIRDRNALFRENWEGHIENVYTLKIMNKTQLAQHYDVSVTGLKNMIPHIPEGIHARPGELLTVTVTLEVALEELEERNTTIFFTVKSASQPTQEVTEESRFLGPMK